MRVRLRRAPVVAAVVVALTAVGLVGAYRYWESYYVSRGFAPVAYVPHARPGRLETVWYYSQALHRRADYLIDLPPGYDPARHRYPVYYLLHGSPGRPAAFLVIAHMPVRMSNLIAQHRMRPMILVLPDGRIGGSTFSDSEWANTPSGAYASYVVNVVHNVDQHFATIAKRQDRVLAGFSMGAYGAANIALHHLSLFGSMQSWSGYYTQTRSGVFAGASRAVLAANSPLEYVTHLRRQLARYPLRAFLFCGRDDNSSVQVKPMADALAAAGGHVSWALYPGGHDWQLWNAHVDQMMELASRDTQLPPPRSSGALRSLTPGVTPLAHGAGRRHRHGRRRGATVRATTERPGAAGHATGERQRTTATRATTRRRRSALSSRARRRRRRRSARAVTA
ncbi:MAG: alpha/beta hydrolase [Solirubrobacteraceae bacterium]